MHTKVFYIDNIRFHYVAIVGGGAIYPGRILTLLLRNCLDFYDYYWICGLKNVRKSVKISLLVFLI